MKISSDPSVVGNAIEKALDRDRNLIKLGLQLDTLKIESVSDDVDSFKSLGRKQIALNTIPPTR